MKCDKCGKELKPNVIGFNSNSPEYYQCDCSGNVKQPENIPTQDWTEKEYKNVTLVESKLEQPEIDYSHPATPLIAEPKEEVLKTDNWISVKDREIPIMEMVYVGCWVNSNGTKVFQIYWGTFDEEHDFYDPNGDDESGWAYEDYEYWMLAKLPPPPEEKL